MNPESNAENIGQTLGFEGVGSVVSKVEEYCAYEEERITLTNQPRMLSLQAAIAILQDEERNLEERLRHAQPPGDVRSRRKAAYYWIVTIFLVAAAFVFSLLAFDPFRLGWKSYLYCLGIAIVTPFLIEEGIEHWNIAGLVKTLTTVGAVAALLSLIFLATIRGDLLTHEVDSTNTVVTSNDGGGRHPRVSGSPRRATAVSAALLAGPEPDRAGLVEVQTVFAHSQITHCRSLGSGCHRSAANHHR
jgi:hypothetical protein